MIYCNNYNLMQF